MRKRIWILIAIAPAVSFTVWLLLPAKEFVYRGRTVSDWVEIYCQDGTNISLHFTAVCNLIDLGSNSVPHILRIAATRDSAIKKTLLQVPPPDKLLEFFKLKRHYTRWAQAASIRPYMAARAFLLVGRDTKLAVPGLIKLLSSDNPYTRIAAADMLRGMGNQASEAFLPLESISSRDSSVAVRSAAEQALRAIKSPGSGFSDQPTEPSGKKSSTSPFSATPPVSWRNQ
jgi:HEAT repeat protein